MLPNQHVPVIFIYARDLVALRLIYTYHPLTMIKHKERKEMKTHGTVIEQMHNILVSP